jgi:hypothetical protein
MVLTKMVEYADAGDLVRGLKLGKHNAVPDGCKRVFAGAPAALTLARLELLLVNTPS